MRWCLGTVVLLALAAGCGRSGQVRYEESLARTPEAAGHAVHERRLADLMRGLDRLRGERLPKVLDVEVEEARQVREVARIAGSMADSAARIPAAMPAELDGDERAGFLALASDLERRARRFSFDAPQLTFEERRLELAAIDATCEQCHLRFRIPGIAREGE